MHQTSSNCKYCGYSFRNTIQNTRFLSNTRKCQKKNKLNSLTVINSFEQAVKFLRCNETALSGIHLINSSQTHVTLVGCDTFHIDNLSIEAPGNTPNTDGIHLQHARNVIITDTEIGTGIIVSKI